jgi:protocatechuate 3,4-dioxygenase beta subunit
MERKINWGLFVYMAVFLMSIDACGQHKKMPRLRNPSGHGFIPCGSCEQPATISSETIISTGEKGERLTISGTVYKADGKTPAEGIILFFYHTDATGHYNQEDDPNDPRLKGWVKTDAKGHYQFTTIKPAPYPQLNTPAHIHVHLFNKNIAENYIDDFWFDGDKLIREADQKRFASLNDFSPIVKLSTNKDGMLTGVRNIRLTQ